MSSVNVYRGNIINVETECIVCPATPALMPGSGVSRNIYYIAGEELYNYCLEKQYNLELGHAVETPAFNIPVKYIIHTLGPYWYGGYEGEAKALASCYIESLKLAISLGLSSIAFPAISTGNGKYPISEASEIAVGTVKSFLDNHPEVDLTVQLICYDDDTLIKYRKANMKEDIDVVKYLKRKEVKVTNMELTREEKSLARKGLFKKELSQEKTNRVVYSVLKRITAKKKNLMLLGIKMTTKRITSKTCDSHNGKKGPYITLDTVTDIHISEKKKGPFYFPEKISFVVHPYAYTKEEDEEKEQIVNAAKNNTQDVQPEKIEPAKKVNIEEELLNL